MVRSEINIPIIVSGILILLTLILNLWWIRIYNIPPDGSDAFASIYLTPYGVSYRVMDKEFTPPILQLFNILYGFSFLTLGIMAVTSGIYFRHEYGRMIHNAIWRKILFLSLAFIAIILFLIWLLVAYGLMVPTGIGLLSIDFKLRVTYPGINYGWISIYIPMRLEFGPGILMIILADIMDILSIKIIKS